jgi:hypothetical protein
MRLHKTGLCMLLAAAMPATAARGDVAQDVLKRGEYIARAGGCSDCHTPWKLGPNGPAPDHSRGLSGHPQELAMPPAPQLAEGPWVWVGAATNTAFSGPWGVSYAPNLTPDRDTGLGAWREQDFIAALRTGRHMGAGRPILPPMPWSAYNHYTDADLKALFAYLQSRPAIRNKVPESQPRAR